MKLVSRAQWGAVARRNAESLRSTAGVKVHYVGDAVSTALATNHNLCTATVRSIQRQHMKTNGWADIAYNALVCPHGSVFVGRGPGIMCAANGPGLNRQHYAVCALVGDSGLTQPSDAMLHGIRDAIEWLRREGAAGGEIWGHRDGYATSCPGPILYRWVRNGAPRPGKGAGGAPTTTGTTTEDMMRDLPTVGRGDQGEDVETVQGLLRARSHADVQIDGDFGEVTETAVRAVQRWGGVDDDGVVGADTWPVLLRIHAAA